MKELTISRLERGDPRVQTPTRARVAAALGLKFDWATKRILPPDDLPPEAFPASSHKSPNPLDQLEEIMDEQGWDYEELIEVIRSYWGKKDRAATVLKIPGVIPGDQLDPKRQAASKDKKSLDATKRRNKARGKE